MNQSKRSAAGVLSTATMMAGLMLFTTSASWAQQKALKEQLTGAWNLVSWDVTPKGGTKAPSTITSPNPKGILILDASGRFAQVRGSADRPNLKITAPRRDIPAAELGEAARKFGANFGTWSVNEGNKTLLLKFELAMIPNNNNNEITNSVTIAKEELRLIEVSQRTGLTNELVYRRAK